MQRKSFLPFLIVLAVPLVSFGCSSTPDEERHELQGALTEAKSLATEIQTWRRNLGTAVPGSVVESIHAFRSRAGNLLDTVSGVSESAATGTDLAGTKQALTSIAKFDTSRFNDASDLSRNSLLDQLSGLAASLHSSVQKVQVRSG